MGSAVAHCRRVAGLLMAKLWFFRLQWLVFIILGVFASDAGTGDPYANQPRIVIQNGNLILKSANNGDIQLSTGQGKVQINGNDVSTLSGTSITSSTGGLISTLGSYLVKLNDLTEQVNQLEENTTSITKKVNRFIGTGQGRLNNRDLRRLMSKVQQLGDKVNTLTQLLTENECNSNPCKNGGTCVDTYNGFICNCPAQWEGITCDIDVNECARFAGTSFGCQNGATCTNTQGGYSCTCPTNWHGIHCTEQYDDCSTASHQELCGHGTCIDEKRAVPGQPKYRCICEPGWQKSRNEPACTEDIDECTGPNRRCSQNPLVACINLPGSFHCGHCPAGYTGNGHSCSDINECEFQNGGCSVQPYVQCSNTLGSRMCGPCPSGYIGNGVQCNFMGVCSINRGGCHPLADCIENSAVTGTYRECRCPSGYIGNGEGLTGCVEAAGMSCANNPCQHGTCQVRGQSFYCTCVPGYFGTLCDREEIDVCFSQPCQNGGTCVRQTGTFTCVCPEGYEGSTCASRSGGCGEYIYGSSGTLQFPETGVQYRGETNCAWVIVANQSKVVNITFDYFQLQYSLDCEENFIQFNDGPNPASRVIGRFCAMDLHGQSFVSTHDQIYFWLMAKEISGSDGFRLNWVATDPVCGGVLNVSDYGAVNSPGYPGKYPMNRNCSWLVRVPIGKRIQFHFATLKMEDHPSCDYDYLNIHDGASDRDAVIGSYCTTVTPPPLTTSGHTALLYFHSDNSISDTGFHITYSSQSTIQGCGGMVTTPTGSIKSPNYPDVYENNLNCEWIIRINPNNRLLLTFKEFTLESHDNCAFDYLEIYGGENDNAPLLGRYCGTRLPDDLFTNNNQLFIRFRSDNSLGHSGFKIEYKSICGGVFTEPTGILSSPYYPENYPSHAECIYDIRLEPGYLINVTFHNLEIEEHSDCRFDFLQIRDGDSESSPLIGNLCGDSAPENIISTYNHLWMKFSTDGSQQNKGFYAQYEAIELGCGGVLTANQGQLSSPQQGERYPHSVNCSWLLRAPAGYIVRLTFTSFVLEPEQDCKFDYVSVEEGTGAFIGRFCGSQKPPIMTSMDNTLLVKFVADASVAREGFTATYEFLDAAETCGGTFYQESGVIRSPGYPERYPHNAHCVWLLRGRNHRQISLNSTFFKIEEHNNCKFDFLDIRNGGYETSPLVGKFCGEKILSPIRSHSNILRLEFKSDGSMSAPGFEFFFDSTTTGCGGTLTSPRGTIISPNYPQPYPYNADCEWKIQVSAGSRISLAIIDVDIEEHRDCRFDYVQVLDGSTESSKSLLRICNNQQNPGAITSSENTLLVRFRSDFSEEAGGFHLVYQTVCNNKLTKRRGVIESPNFPNTYPHNHNCSWTIEAPSGSNVSLAFSHLLLESTGDNCDADYVEVLEINKEDKQTQLGKYCGTQSKPPGTIVTTTNRAVVRLVTDNSITREGFRLEWIMKGCGGDIYDKPTGNITSPNYPNGYPLETTCYWHIWYPPGSRVELTINELDLEGAPNCVYDYVRVYAGEDDESPLLQNTCAHITQPQIIQSHGNHMVVKFESDFAVNRRGFSATFKKISGGCGGVLNTGEGSFLSPNFPNAYNANDDCNWIIQVKKAHRVALEFYDFNVPEGDNCTNGYVAVYDGNSSSSNLLLKHCGDKPGEQIFSTGNQMLLRLAADGNNVGTGFRAHYTTGCGSRLLADEEGEISSTLYPHPSSINCSWIILASNTDEKVILIVTHIQMPDSNNCTYNSMVVRDGDLPDSPIISQYCGLRSPPPIISRGSILHVSLMGWGVFRGIYGLASIQCGGSYTSVQGTFGSPGYPTNYDRDTECVWIIQASEGNRVHLTFEAFNLEESENCNKDYVEIHENGVTGNLIGRYCGSHIPSNVTAARNLWIKFKSDDIETQAGFLAHYELQHGTVLNGTEGIISSPGYPQRHLISNEYKWTVYVPVEQFVSIQFLDLDIPNSNSIHDENCPATKIEIFDGLEDTAPPLGEFCRYQLPDPVISTGNVVLIKFTTMVYQAGIFRLKWHAVTPDGVTISNPEPTTGETCWEEAVINDTGEFIFKSPNYPQNYPNDINCTYIVRVPHFQHVQLNVTDLHMEAGFQTCNYDRLEVYYMPNPNVNEWILNGSLCGSLPLGTVLESPTNLMKLILITDKHMNYEGFRSIARAKCGTHFVGKKGVLRSSFLLPELSQVNTFKPLNCEYFISVKPRRTIQLKFKRFSIPSNMICSTNYIKIRNGASTSSPPLGTGTFCGTNYPPMMETSSNEVYIQIVVSTLSGGATDFELQYEELSVGCGGHLFVTEDFRYVEITSPNFPNPPTHDTECEWVIVSPSATRMRVDFDSEFHMNPDCYSGENLEFLEIHDGGTEMAPSLHRFCGHDQPSSVMSTGNALFVRYVTAVDTPQAGFKAKIGIANCGGTIAGYTATIHSPNYPDPYGNSEECEWFLKMPMGYHIILNLTDFNTPDPPSGANCTETDYLEVRNFDSEGELLAIICGTSGNLSRIINVPGSQAYMKFKSNSRDTLKGFEVKMDGAFDDGCGAFLEDPFGVITSPNYPNALSAVRECRWGIRAPPGRKVKFIFQEFNLPKDYTTGICISYVEVLTSNSWRRRNITPPKQLCGTSLPESVTSSSGYMGIRFFTHGLSSGQGFSLTYSTEEEAICGGVLPMPTGEISSPNITYLVGEEAYECHWTTAVEINQTVVFRFDILDIPGLMANYCIGGSLFTFGAKRFLYRFCGNYTSEVIMTSPIPNTHVVLTTVVDKPMRGIHGTYNVSNCGGMFSGQNLEITSPGYPNNYPPNTVCHWIISVPEGETITLTVADLRLETDCDKDYVLVRNGFQNDSPRAGKFCGTHAPAPISSTGNTMTVLFNSDNYGTAPGFKMTSVEVQRGCGGLIHMHNGNLSSPNRPSHYDNNVECSWVIEFEPGYIVKLEFVGRFDLETDPSCRNDFLLIEEMNDDNTWYVAEKKCGATTPPPYISKNRKIKITFQTNDRITGDGFDIRYSATCGGNFTELSGAIFSPAYPQQYDHSLDCVYTIGKANHYVSLTFDDYFSLEGNSDCRYDYITIQYNNSLNTVQGPYCGTEVPASRTLQGPVTLRFVTDSSYAGHGFSLRFNILECGAVLTESSGRIGTTNLPNQEMESMDCTWQIVAPSNKVIALRFMFVNITISYRCWSDYLEIRDGLNTGPLIGKICGNSTPIVKSTGNVLTLVLHLSYGNANIKGFSASYETTYGINQGCGGTKMMSSGAIQSLDTNSDGLYEPNLDCRWMVVGDDPDMVFQITFERFDIELSTNATCVYDFVELREGIDPDSALIGRFCGSVAPTSVITSGNRFSIVFHSSSEINKAGFKLNFQSIASPCGRSALESGTIPLTLKSPSYPNPYPANIRCKWTIWRNASSRNEWTREMVQLTIIEFDVPCDGDYLEIQKVRVARAHENRFRGNRYGIKPIRLCGPLRTHEVFAPTGMTVIFRSDAKNNGARGFSLSYKNATCNRNYTRESDVILNPGYPSRHNSDKACNMTIVASPGKTISLYFSQIEMYGGRDKCDETNMKVYDGMNSTAPQVGFYCGFESPNPVFSTGRYLYLETKLLYGTGLYNMIYTTSNQGRGCGGSIDAEDGVISSPLYPMTYNKSGECVWFLSVPGYHSMRVEFKTLDLNSTAGCDSNYVELFDGHTQDVSKRVGRYCGSDLPGDHNSRTNEVTIKFKSDTNNHGPGFLLRFHTNPFLPDKSLPLIQRHEEAESGNPYDNEIIYLT